ncbi:MAG TPA: DUF1343 domain-containing protein [Puia sp.]|jgi:uncharacterized protein YbbC (DUF1343 family)|nr:DUF1343 domain-containing protein [Puia sp.]
MRTLLFLLIILSIQPPVNAQPLTGAEQLNEYLPLLQGKRVAILTNNTAVVNGINVVDTLVKRGVHIVRIFSPEHGFRGDADAGATVGNQVDSKTGIPIVSLYGSKRKPSAADLSDVDVMLYDIQDVGVRYYTYPASLQRYMEAAVENHRPLIILDRPDPNGQYVDGPVLDTAFHSFVGMQPIPVVYGMTIGEYARMLLGEGWVRSDPEFRLTVIQCKHYTHRSSYTLPVKPSPNLPNMQSVWLYPSLCLFEGTGVSLGRGTEKPFQLFGAPSLPHDLYSFTPRSVPGATNPPLLGQVCYGYDLSSIDVARETGHKMSLKWLLLAYRLYPDKDHFFNGNGSGFDRLAGSSVLRQQIHDGLSEEAIRKTWEPALQQFKTIRKKYLLYAE